MSTDPPALAEPSMSMTMPVLPVVTRSAPSAILAVKLEALRRRQTMVALGSGLGLTLVVMIELLAVAMFVDWWLELAWGLRLVSLVGQGVVFGFFVWRLVLVPWMRQPDEDQLALWVEKARPEYRSRLIASVQLTRPGAGANGTSAELVGALVGETEDMARACDFREIVSLERLKTFALLAAVIPLLGVGGLVAGRETSGQLLKRVLLCRVPVPRKTRILVPEPVRIIGIGDSVLLEAYVEGIIPAHGKVEIKYRSRRAQDFSLEQDKEDPLHFGRLLANLQESFSYRFFLGDGTTEEVEVRAVPRPTVASLECEQDFPAYTGLASTKRSLGDLTLLAGSVLRVRATATKDLEAAVLKLVGIERAVPLPVTATNRRALAGQFSVPAKGLTGFQIQMLDTGNMESRDDAIYRIDVLADKRPTVRLTYPDRKEELITRVATLLVAFEAADDFRIARIRLKYKVDTIEQGAEKALELELAGNSPQRLRRRYEWRIPENIPGVTEGSTIEFWIEVEDNNNVTGPGLASSDHQLAKVVSDAEKRADLLNRAGDYLGSINDVAADQERLNKSLGEIIREKAGLR